MMVLIRSTSVILFILCFLSCNSDDTERLPLTLYNDQVEAHIDELVFVDEDHVVGIGGDTWSMGIGISIDIDAKSIVVDTLSGKRIFGLQKSQGSLVAAGLDGIMYEKATIDVPWRSIKLSEWGVIRDIISTPDGYIAVGGKSLRAGFIYHINEQYEVTKLYNLQQEMSSVAATTDSYIASGYGSLYRYSNDQWQPMDVSGDFFLDIAMHDGDGLVVGSNGAVLSTHDDGKTWQAISSPNQLLSSNTSWNAIYMDTLNHRWIIGGDDGAIMLIDIDTDARLDYQLATSFDIKALAYRSGKLILADQHGRIGQVNID